MNAREEARRMAEVMLAFADGAEVQYRLHDGKVWDDTDVPDWDFSLWDYRVKPKPCEGWGVVHKDGRVWGVYATAAGAQRAVDEYARGAMSAGAFRVVHMREVTE